MLQLTWVIAFPTSLLHDCKLITLTTALCIPRVKCNQTETCKQIDPNQHCIFECHALMWWVLKYRLEATLFSFGSRFVQIVRPCLHIKGLQGQRQMKHVVERCCFCLCRTEWAKQLSSASIHFPHNLLDIQFVKKTAAFRFMTGGFD